MVKSKALNSAANILIPILDYNLTLPTFLPSPIFLILT